MKANKRYHRWLGAGIGFLLLMSACTSEEVVAPVEPKSEGEFVLYSTDYTVAWEEGSRSLEAMSDRYQKQIHNLYYFFYDAEGYLEKIFYQNVNPTMRVQVGFEDFKDEDGLTAVTPQGHIFVIANAQKMATGDHNEKPILVSSERVHVGNADEWRRLVPTVSDFQKRAIFPLYYVGDATLGGEQGGNPTIGLPDHMIMFGYFDGTLIKEDGDKKYNVQMPLGRLAVRMRIALSGTGLGPQAKVSLINAPAYTAIYPDLADYSTLDGNSFWTNAISERVDTGNGEDNTTLKDGSGKVIGVDPGSDKMYGGITGSKGNYTASLFYYCGGNSWERGNSDPYRSSITKLKIETWDAEPVAGKEPVGTPNRTYTIELGHNGPEVVNPPYNEERDYALYRNTSYTFNIELAK